MSADRAHGHDPSDMPTHTPQRLRRLRRILSIHDEPTLPAGPTDHVPGRAPRTAWAHPPGWCYPGEHVYASSPCHAWSTRDRPHTDGSPALLDHGQGALYITNMQTMIFPQFFEGPLCVPHWMIAETGILRSDLEIALTLGSLVRLRFPADAEHYQKLINQLRHERHTPATHPD